MKLLIIRHGDPDYSIDSLTEKGWKEAELLSKRISALPVTAVYTSPLGRARDTASLSLKKLNMQAEILPWLREFDAPITNAAGERRIPWDHLPESWTNEPAYYDRERWFTTPLMRTGDVESEYLRVCQGLDELLKKHGYERDGMLYRAVSPNRDTIVLFCHFGVECVMISHLLGISPMILWHGFCAAPSSVTTFITEERRKGIAYFRAGALGDISHLYAGGEPAAFAARFCETYDCAEERHD